MGKRKPKSEAEEKLKRGLRDAPAVRAARYRRWATQIENGQGAAVARALRRDADQLRPKK